jgi:hypothetical protein
VDNLGHLKNGNPSRRFSLTAKPAPDDKVYTLAIFTTKDEAACKNA